MNMHVWEAETGNTHATYQSLPVEALAWSPDNTRVVTACANKVAQVWRIPYKEWLSILSTGIACLCMSTEVYPELKILPHIPFLSIIVVYCLPAFLSEKSHTDQASTGL